MQSSSFSFYLRGEKLCKNSRYGGGGTCGDGPQPPIQHSLPLLLFSWSLFYVFSLFYRLGSVSVNQTIYIKHKTKPNRTVYELSSHLNQTIIFSFHHLCFFPSLLPFFLSQWRIIITRLLLATRISSVIASNSSSIATSRSSRPSSSLQRIPPTTPSPSSE